MKRKAVFLESDYTPSSPPSMTHSSTTSSPDSMNTEPFHSNLSACNFHLLPASNAPWLHSRTRKRVRDNRPAEIQIHADTVRRLFDAQRPQSHAEDEMMMDGVEHTSYTPPMDMSYTSDQDNDSSEPLTPDEMHDIAHGSIEANQRSLHDFFQRRAAPAPQAQLQPQPHPFLFHQQQQPPSHSRTHSATSLPSHLTTRPPTPQEISAGAPAPVLRERSSMGFLGGMNASSPEHEIENMETILLGTHGTGGGYLPCDFNKREGDGDGFVGMSVGVCPAPMMVREVGVFDAMVMG